MDVDIGALRAALPEDYQIDFMTAWHPLKAPEDEERYEQPRHFRATDFIRWLEEQAGKEYWASDGGKIALIDYAEDIFSDGSREDYLYCMNGSWSDFFDSRNDKGMFMSYCKDLQMLCCGDLSRLKALLDETHGRMAHVSDDGDTTPYESWKGLDTFALYCKERGLDLNDLWSAHLDWQTFCDPLKRS